MSQRGEGDPGAATTRNSNAHSGSNMLNEQETLLQWCSKCNSPRSCSGAGGQPASRAPRCVTHGQHGIFFAGAAGTANVH